MSLPVRGLRSTPDGILSRPAMARTLAFFYLAGATLIVASIALPYPDEHVVAQLAVSAVAYATGAALLLLGKRLPRLIIPPCSPSARC